MPTIRRFQQLLANVLPPAVGRTAQLLLVARGEQVVEHGVGRLRVQVDPEAGVAHPAAAPTDLGERGALGAGVGSPASARTTRAPAH
eukprot:5373721-Pyramimonas_sp.AAC.1